MPLLWIFFPNQVFMGKHLEILLGVFELLHHIHDGMLNALHDSTLLVGKPEIFFVVKVQKDHVPITVPQQPESGNRFRQSGRQLNHALFWICQMGKRGIKPNDEKACSVKPKQSSGSKFFFFLTKCTAIPNQLALWEGLVRGRWVVGFRHSYKDKTILTLSRNLAIP